MWASGMPIAYTLLIGFMMDEFIQNLAEKKFSQVITGKKKYCFHENMYAFGVLLSQLIFLIVLTFLYP